MEKIQNAGVHWRGCINDLCFSKLFLEALFCFWKQIHCGAFSNASKCFELKLHSLLTIPDGVLTFKTAWGSPTLSISHVKYFQMLSVLVELVYGCQMQAKLFATTWFIQFWKPRFIYIFWTGLGTYKSESHDGGRWAMLSSQHPTSTA